MQETEGTSAAVDANRERDGSHALAMNDGFEPMTVEAEGSYIGETIRYLHRVTFFWNERGQFMITIWNEAANVQGAGAKALDLDQAKELRNYLNRTIPQVEGKR